MIEVAVSNWSSKHMWWNCSVLSRIILCFYAFSEKGPFLNLKILAQQTALMHSFTNIITPRHNWRIWLLTDKSGLQLFLVYHTPGPIGIQIKLNNVSFYLILLIIRLVFFFFVPLIALVPGALALDLPTLILQRFVLLCLTVWPQNLYLRVKNHEGHWGYCWCRGEERTV